MNLDLSVLKKQKVLFFHKKYIWALHLNLIIIKIKSFVTYIQDKYLNNTKSYFLTELILLN